MSDAKFYKSPLILRILGLGKPYFVKTPWWMKAVFPSRLWKVKTKEPIIYLSFDDGPHPEITPFILDELKKHDAKATFFCIGKNVMLYPEMYQRILDEGHRVGNHTFNHLNGWKTPDPAYLADITEAARHIHSDLFRPPYGRINSSQVKSLNNAMKYQARIVMWDVLSGDFDTGIDALKVMKRVLRGAGAGSIIVFHDNEKSFPRLKGSLPAVLTALSEKGYRFESIA
ncbi:MAG TPA: polysaccharide deacetylase family protein [Chitinophagaceae bacterium]|nr:polysaccharide deacetylase family protein [Chitinophagaceae bacterium]